MKVESYANFEPEDPRRDMFYVVGYRMQLRDDLNWLYESGPGLKPPQPSADAFSTAWQSPFGSVHEGDVVRGWPEDDYTLLEEAQGPLEEDYTLPKVSQGTPTDDYTYVDSLTDFVQKLIDLGKRQLGAAGVWRTDESSAMGARGSRQESFPIQTNRPPMLPALDSIATMPPIDLLTPPQSPTK